MKDRERLEELINRKPSRWGNLTIKEFERDIKILQKQAEEKQELEEKLKWLQSDFEEIKRMAEDHRSKQLHLEQQNKQYEKAIGMALSDIDDYDFESVRKGLRQALQNNREG